MFKKRPLLVRMWLNDMPLPLLPWAMSLAELVATVGVAVQIVRWIR